ncbi:MAG: SUMF1/EgtB/PvdO family nonheme iron enzyme, partial [Candidatus Delongbacteria bacterium]
MICKKCNTLNSNDAKVCVNCGQKLSGSQISKEKKSSIKPQSRKQINPGKSSRGKKANRSDKKRSNLGTLLIVLLIVIIGGGYILVNTDSGQKYVEDMKKNDMVGEYVSLADSLLKSYMTDLNPEEEKDKPEEKKEEKAEVKKESDQPEKPAILRVNRDMLYYTSLKDDMRMILIPSGTVTIGSEKGSINEKPVHDVYVEEFYIDEHEVT